MSAGVLDRLDAMEERLAAVERTLERLTGEDALPAWAPPEPRPEPVSSTLMREPTPRRVPAPPQPAPSPRPPRRQTPPRPKREIDWSAAFGAKGLAVAGGVVTVLGIVFFFALAVNRGWIGPGARVALGSAASLFVFVGGLELRRRFGRTHAALAAVGAGIAGGYATLLAATALYDLLPGAAALVVAAGIAAVGLAVSLLWREELVAGIGLIGAMVAPALLASDTGLTAVGIAFVALVLAATVAVAVALRWRWLLITGAVLAAPQVLVLFADRARPEAGLLALSAVFCLLYLVGGVGWQLRGGTPRLGGLASWLVVASAGVGFYSAQALFQNGAPRDRGIYLLVCAAVYGAIGAGFYVRRARPLGNLLIALALALGAVGVADVLSDGTLTYAWAAEAAALAWLASRLREVRFQASACAYLVLALVHALAIDALPSGLFSYTDNPASGVASLIAVALAAAAVAVWAVDWDDVPRWAGALRHSFPVKVTAAALSAVLAIDALSLVVLAAYVAWWPGGGESAFEHGQVAVTGMWTALGVVAVAAGVRRRGSAVALAGLAWLVVVLVKTLQFDATHLPPGLYSYAFLEVAAGLLLAVLLVQALRPKLWPDATVAWFGAATSLVVVLVGLGTLLDGRAQGAAFLGVAALYGTLAGWFLVRRDRTFGTLLSALAAGVAASAAAQLVQGQLLVAVWAASGVAFAALTRRTGERRFQLAAFGYLALGLALSLVSQATPVDFLSASRHPADGVLGLLALVLATLVVARLSGALRAPARDAVDSALDELQPRLRSVGTWLAGGLGLYALSLCILELGEAVGPRGIAANFQSGHTAVSAVWGVLGLALLYIGLRTGRAALRIGGLVLFGVSLAKLFVYDLSRLSSITRALSFLAVGAVLLLGGFFYQRLGARVENGTAASA
jgi:uncharacterized membrane protein